jgi:hypothetical protein
MNYTEDTIDKNKYPTEFGRSIDEYVRSNEYGKSLQKISMAIVFNGSDPYSYMYAIRQNSTNFNVVEDQDSVKPATRTTPKSSYLYMLTAASDLETCSSLSASSGVNSGDLGVLGTSCTGQYIYNGVLAAQRVVHDFILYDTESAAVGYNVAEAGVQFVQFPQAEYQPSGFFTDNGMFVFFLGGGVDRRRWLQFKFVLTTTFRFRFDDCFQLRYRFYWR